MTRHKLVQDMRWDGKAAHAEGEPYCEYCGALPARASNWYETCPGPNLVAEEARSLLHAAFLEARRFAWKTKDARIIADRLDGLHEGAREGEQRAERNWALLATTPRPLPGSDAEDIVWRTSPRLPPVETDIDAPPAATHPHPPAKAEGTPASLEKTMTKTGLP